MAKLILHDNLTSCFQTSALSINNLELGKDIWIVYAHGSQSRIKKLTTKSIRAFEQYTPSGLGYFCLFLICQDDRKESYHICIDDINLNPKNVFRYTNHFTFSDKVEAEYYKELCCEFNIHSLFKQTQQVKN